MFKIIFFALSLSLSAQASTDPWFEKGNGGFGILCKESALTTFDLFEAQRRYGYTLDHNSVGTVDQRVQYLLAKLSRLSPKRAALYQSWYAQFYSEMTFVESFGELTPNDFGFAVLPSGCHFVPIALQRPRARTDLPRYMILEANWNLLDVESKSALILHELMFREALLPGNTHYNSESVRAYNALLHSTKFNELSLNEYFFFLQEAEFADAEYQGYTILLGNRTPDFKWKKYSFEFFDRARLKKAFLSSSQLEKSCAIHPIGIIEFSSSAELKYILPNSVSFDRGCP